MAAGRGAARAKGVYAVVGADSYLADQAVERVLRAAGLEGGDAVTVLRGEETTWARVADAARSGSLFAPRRAVIVRNADALKGEGDELDSYLADPDPGVALVFVAAKPDRRRATWKRLLDRAEVLAADPLKGRAVRGYVAEEIRRRGLALSEDALAELIEQVGQDLRRLMGELDKLEFFAAGGKGRLSADDLASLLGRGIGQPLYRIGDAFSLRRAGEALALLETVLDDGEPPLKVLSNLHHAARRLRAARALGDARVPREALAARLGVPPFKVGDVMEAARAWSEADLVRAVAALDRADRRVKTGMDPRVALSAAIVEACGGGKGAATRARTGR